MQYFVPEFVPESLVIRRLNTDLCEVYTYLHGSYMYKTDTSLYFTLSQHTLRGNSLTLVNPYARTLIRSKLFSHSSQHLEQPTKRRGQLTVAGRIQRQIEIPATWTRGIIHPSNPGKYVTHCWHWYLSHVVIHNIKPSDK